MNPSDIEEYNRLIRARRIWTELLIAFPFFVLILLMIFMFGGPDSGGYGLVIGSISYLTIATYNLFSTLYKIKNLKTTQPELSSTTKNEFYAKNVVEGNVIMFAAVVVLIANLPLMMRISEGDFSMAVFAVLLNALYIFYALYSVVRINNSVTHYRMLPDVSKYRVKFILSIVSFVSLVIAVIADIVSNMYYQDSFLIALPVILSGYFSRSYYRAVNDDYLIAQATTQSKDIPHEHVQQ